MRAFLDFFRRSHRPSGRRSTAFSANLEWVESRQLPSASVFVLVQAAASAETPGPASAPAPLADIDAGPAGLALSGMGEYADLAMDDLMAAAGLGEFEESAGSSEEDQADDDRPDQEEQGEEGEAGDESGDEEGEAGDEPEIDPLLGKVSW